MSHAHAAGALLGCILFTWLVCDANKNQLLRPYSLRLSPNAIQDPHIPLRVEMDGPPGETLQVLILPGCGSRTQPAEPPGRGSCRSPTIPIREVLLDPRHGHASLDLILDGSDGQAVLPIDVPLWLRVAIRGGDGGYRQARFSIAKDRCAVWQSLIDQFGGGRCMTGLDAMFDPTRNVGSGPPQGTLEVRRIDPHRPEIKALTVVGTRGATGAAWDSLTAILVTLGAQSTTPGLYRIDLNTSTKTLLYKSSPDTELTAPISLATDPDRFILVVEKHERTTTLLALRSGQVQRRIPLSGPVHQLLRADAYGQQVLGVRLRATSVDLFSVVLQSGIETTGGDTPLLLAFRRSPSDGLGVLEYEDVATPNGWDLRLLEPESKLLRDLAVGPGDDLLPSWRADGNEILYLGQVSSERSTLH